MRFGAGFALALCCPGWATAAEPPAPVVGKTFAVAPVTTDLQRRLLRGAGPDSAALLLMDAGPLFRDAKTLDAEALQLGEVRKALKAFRSDKGKPVIHFAVHFGPPPDVSRDAHDVLEFALEGVARECGLAPGVPTNTAHNGRFVFADYVAPLGDGKGAGEVEAGVGDERARAYPVRTPLSKVLTGSVAGVVDVRTPIACRGDAWLPDDVDRSVRAALEKLKLAKGGRVTFLLHVLPDRDKNAQEKLRRACRVWAEDAGLELWQFSY